MSNSGVSLNERFERKVIFRLARWLPLGLGGLATIALLIAVVALVYAITPMAEPTKPGPLATPAPVKLTRDQIASYQPDRQPDNAGGDVAAPASPAENADQSKAATDPHAIKLAAGLGALGKTLESRGIAFVDHSERRCTYFNPYTNDCMNYETVVTQKGVGDQVLELIAIYDDKSDAKIENVDSKDGWNFNLRIDSRLADKAAVIAELNQILQPVPASETRKYLDNWMKMRKEKEQAQLDQYQKQADDQEAKYDSAVAEHDAKVVTKAATRYTSLIAAGSALAILVFSGMVLAVIAIERHMRGMAVLLEKIASERNL